MRAPMLALIELLPAGADKSWFSAEWARLEARRPEELRRQREDYLDKARLCDEVLARLPIRHDRAELETHRASCLVHADSLGRELRQFKARRYIELLILAKRVGVSLGYTAEPVPHGPGIDYLQAATAVLGESISPHTACRLLKLYRKQQPGEAAGHIIGKLRADSFMVDESGRIVER